MTELTFSACNIRHPGARERQKGATSSVYLSLFTPSGQLREVPLTRADLIKIINQASGHLVTLEKGLRT